MNIDLYSPIKITPARAWRTYLGGKQIDELHGNFASTDGHFPEEWIMSTVTARNAGREMYTEEGLSFIDSTEITLKTLIDSSPALMLGAAHTSKYGAQTGVLIKLIDAAERLTIQSHPDRATAQRLFNSIFGKTECWQIIAGRDIEGVTPCIYLGFKSGITREKWEQVFSEQKIPEMLSFLHRFEVKPGDTFLIEGQVPHAIGGGCLLVEIQEPTDYTIRTERITPSGFKVADSMCHQGLGFEKMFDCFDYKGCTKEEARIRWQIMPTEIARGDGYIGEEVIGYKNTPMFKILKYNISDCCIFDSNDTFSCLYIVSGSGRLRYGNGVYLSANQGDQFFIPASAKIFHVENTLSTPMVLYRFYGPQ